MSSMDLAKVVVARSANATHDRVLVQKIWESQGDLSFKKSSGSLNIRDVIIEGLKVAEGKEYNFLMYNCRHFVSDLLLVLEVRSQDNSSSSGGFKDSDFAVTEESNTQRALMDGNQTVKIVNLMTPKALKPKSSLENSEEGYFSM
jgi:hypothetical protein